MARSLTPRRLSTLLATSVLGGLVVVAAGSAIPASGSSPTGYVTRVTAIRPALPGVSATAASNGESMTVTNSSATPVVVEGYQHEPYLEISSTGVLQNSLSPAVYLNKNQFVGAIPHDVNADQPPQWHRLAGFDHYQWHDHRIHWMGATEPPSVAADHHHSHLIERWAVPIMEGQRHARILGTLVWYPGSRWSAYLPYLVIALALAVVVAVQLTVVRRRRRPDLVPQPGP